MSCVWLKSAIFFIHYTLHQINFDVYTSYVIEMTLLTMTLSLIQFYFNITSLVNRPISDSISQRVKLNMNRGCVTINQAILSAIHITHGFF